MNILNFHIEKDIKGIELMSAKMIAHKSLPHVHEEYAIGVMERGVQGYDTKRKDKYMISGDIPVVNPFTLHSSENLDEKGFQYRMFYIKPELIQEIASHLYENIAVQAVFPKFAINDTYLEKNLIHLHKILENDSYDIIQKQNYFYEVITYLIKNHSSSHNLNTPLSNYNNAIIKVLDYLHAHFTDKIELSNLAEISQLSPYHLNRIFAQAKGIPSHQYLINLRLNHARKLLKSNKSVTEVAYETGFFDQSHFTRNFKLFLGITPKKYQQQVR